jgi:ubiquinone/menaquinone biosynthesis C-methylase UbiE
MEPRLNNVEIPLTGWRNDRLPQTIADRTRKVYDRLALVYPVSTMLFHSKAHRCALEIAGIEDGMRVLEVATGSGEMFRRIVKRNRSGDSVGLDLSPNMAARTHRRIVKEFPGSSALCKAVDARYMPFRDNTFDALVCCYLLELLSNEDILLTLREFRRVLKRHGRFALVLIGDNTEMFNRVYRVCGKLAPAFWGRQVATRVPQLVEASGLRILADQAVRQTFYPSRVLLAQKQE